MAEALYLVGLFTQIGICAGIWLIFLMGVALLCIISIK
jgi:hypothetical protein